MADVFSSLKQGTSDFGIVPIENSTEGVVNQTYDLMLSNKACLVSEHLLRIEHCLAAPQGAQLEKLRRVYSHPQALAQCREYLDSIGLEQIPYNDTATSARTVSENGNLEAAAVCNSRAACMYGLNVLRTDIGTEKENYTRFIVLSQIPVLSYGADKTTLSFTLENRFGTMASAFNCFAVYGINITPPTVRPIKGKQWEYTFYLDCNESATSWRMQNALDMLRKSALDIRIHGSYKSSKQRL